MNMSDVFAQLREAQTLLANAGRESANSTVTLTIRIAKGKRRRFSARYRGTGGFGIYWNDVPDRVGRVMLATRPRCFQQEWADWSDPRDVFLAALLATGVSNVVANGSPPRSWVHHRPALAATVLVENIQRELARGDWMERARIVQPEGGKPVRIVPQSIAAVELELDARTLRNWRCDGLLTKHPMGRIDLEEARAVQRGDRTRKDAPTPKESSSRSRKKRKSELRKLPS